MPTACTPEALEFQAVAGRAVVARFDGRTLTSDGGAVLLREVERRTGILAQFAACFRDARDPARVTHSVAALVRQRVYALALGYEDLNDHDQLRHDPLFAVLAEADDLGAPGAGQSTLNRLELSAATVPEAERYKKIAVEHAAVDRLLVAFFVQAHATAPAAIVLDVDATDDPVHGAQEGRFFHGYYGHYCYLPLLHFLWGAAACGPTALGGSRRERRGGGRTGADRGASAGGVAHGAHHRAGRL
ncbi:MAG: transposase, partial [Gemmatimonadaceae bacterium]